MSGIHSRCAPLLLLLVLGACGGTAHESARGELSVTIANGFGERTHRVSCDPPNADVTALCRAIEQNAAKMLHDPRPNQICAGGHTTIHLHVAGTWAGEKVDADVDACSGNLAGERLWLSHLPPPPLPDFDS